MDGNISNLKYERTKLKDRSVLLESNESGVLDSNLSGTDVDASS